MVSDVTADYPLGLLHNKRGLGVEGGVNKTPLHFYLVLTIHIMAMSCQKIGIFPHTKKIQ